MSQIAKDRRSWVSRGGLGFSWCRPGVRVRMDDSKACARMLAVDPQQLAPCPFALPIFMLLLCSDLLFEDVDIVPRVPDSLTQQALVAYTALAAVYAGVVSVRGGWCYRPGITEQGMIVCPAGPGPEPSLHPPPHNQLPSCLHVPALHRE